MSRIHRVKIHREGTAVLIPLLGVIVVLNVPLWLFMVPGPVPVTLSALSMIGYVFVFNFFRCPRREYTGQRRNHVISSVDGKVVAIERVYEGEFLKSDAIMVSVFMSPLNVHANWFPVDGTVDYVKHHEGRFLSAWLPKASTENERSTVGITMDNGCRITVRQIAGAMARRIVTYAQAGEEADISDHLGFIKFGSRVDIYLPVNAHVLLKMNETTRGGVTPLAIVSPEQDPE